MASIDVDFEDTEVEGDFMPVPGVKATCTRCDHEVEAHGRTDASRRSCLARMREECPLGQTNYYVDSGDGGDS